MPKRETNSRFFASRTDATRETKMSVEKKGGRRERKIGEHRKAQYGAEKRVPCSSWLAMERDVSVIRFSFFLLTGAHLLVSVTVPLRVETRAHARGRRRPHVRGGSQRARIFFSNLIYRQFDGRKTRRHFRSPLPPPPPPWPAPFGHPTPPSWPLLPPSRGAA